MRHFKTNFQALLFLIALIFYSGAQANTLRAEHNTAGELELTSYSGQRLHAMVLDSDIKASISGLVATIKLTQRFKNNSSEWVNGRYVFPLPENGAVDGMVITVGDRRIVGSIKKKQEAKKQFEAAKKAGKKAGLLQQHRPNLFSLAVANIAPNEEIVSEITIIDHVQYRSKQFSLRFPTTLTPRYIPGRPLIVDSLTRQALSDNVEVEIEEVKSVTINRSSGWGVDTDVVDDASQITPPQFRNQGEQINNTISINVDLHAGLALNDVYSDTHGLSISTQSGTDVTMDQSGKAQITLKNGSEPMDRDFVLTWTPAPRTAPSAAFFQQELKGKHYSMAMLMPPTVQNTVSLPRDITFIVDSSGSMAGTSMQNAKQSVLFALNQLTVNDRFNVIDFDSSFTALFPQSVSADTYHLDEARRMVNSLRANGGTRMFEPLNFALQTPSQEGYLKQIIFITDGSVGNEAQLFELISRSLGDARLFTVGIGSAPNSYFMSKAAQFGRGSFTYINNVADTVSKVTELFNKINRPIVKDININNASGAELNMELYPQRIPDLYAGEPLMVFIKSDDALQDLQISGTMMGQHWQRNLSNANAVNTHRQEQQPEDTQNLDALWARKKVAHLMDSLHMGQLDAAAVESEVTQLGIAHHLLTKYTSFIAVEETISRPKSVTAKDKNIPNLMPKGSQMMAPQTATAADLLKIVGALFMLMSLMIRRRAGNSKNKPSLTARQA